MAIRPVRRLSRPVRGFSRPGPLGVLSHPQYRRYSLAALLAFTAFALQMFLRGWLVLDLTHSPFMVSLVPALVMLPMLVFTLVGGELADRFNRQRLVLLGDAAAAAWYTGLAVLILTGVVQAWHVLALTAAQGVTGALAGPARQALIAELVPSEEQRHAIGLSPMMFNVSQIIGPVIGGAIVVMMSMGAASVVAVVLIIPALPMYALLKPVTAVTVKRGGSMLLNVKNGIRYVAAHPTLRWLLLGGAVIVLTVNSWGALFPSLAEEVLNRGAVGLATIQMAVGIGAVLGTLVSVLLSNRLGDGPLEVGSGFVFAGLVLAFAFSTVFPLSVVLAALAALAGTTFFVTNMTAMQMTADPEYRGRVVSVRFVMFGLNPLGMLAMGAAAESLGVQWALGIFAVLGALLFMGVQLAFRPRVMPAVSAPVLTKPPVPAPQGGSE
ncbi:MAG: MFS transporter [Dehalococcoidia bacterium]